MATQPEERHLMQWRNTMVCLALSACATPDANGTATAGPADAAPVDAAVTDAAPYAAAVALPVGPSGTYAERCQKFGAALCAHLQNCCTAAVPGCVEDVAQECLKPGKFTGLATAAMAGKLVLDPGLAAQCDAALAAVGATCSKTAVTMVLIPCLFAWTDPAGLGEPCQDGTGEVCAGGKGRCGDIAMPTCVTAAEIGAACPKAPAECTWGALCAWPAKLETCVAADSVCGDFGDVVMPCSQGKACLGGTCVVDPGVATGGACVKSADCRGENDCVAGKCVSKLCKNLPGG